MAAIRSHAPAVQGTSIVLLGDFSPKIFHPIWFAQAELIGKSEAENAEIEVVHADLASFSLDWLKVQVIQNRFALTTTQESHFEPLRDLAVGTFKLLSHTPIRAMGINRDMHFPMQSVEEWHAFGHRMAPKEHWGALEKPGLISLTMQGVRPDESKGYIRVKVEPSTVVHPGIFFSVNDHFQVLDASSPKGSYEIMNLLQKSWNDSLKRAEQIIYSLLEDR